MPLALEYHNFGFRKEQTPAIGLFALATDLAEFNYFFVIYLPKEGPEE